MKFSIFLTNIFYSIVFSFACLSSAAHDIYFCGEKIPLDDELVKNKLMDFIRKRVNYGILPSLRDSINKYMPKVEYYLRQNNLPEDFKYLAIVESGFKTDAVSGAGAVGFWQLMKKTAIGNNLIVNDLIDERRDFDKSSMVACKELLMAYSYIRNKFGISSWVLTAAAYNNGIGIIAKKIKDSDTDNYFTMNLNPETAAYVYKIIAVKELFEFPELYMNNFGYNVFTKMPSSKTQKSNNGFDADLSAFNKGMDFKINEKDGQHPADLKRGLRNLKKNAEKETYISATINGKHKHFKDGEVIIFTLQDDLKTDNTFTAKNNPIQGKAWIIDGRAMVNLGLGHEVVVLDITREKGIPLSNIKKNEPVILKVITSKR